MSELLYTVRCQFTGNNQLSDHWLAWLRDIHIDDVLKCGAQSATIVKMDVEPDTFEIRYIFESRQAFEMYEAEHAPRLRAEGLELFPEDQGISYERTTGDVVFKSDRVSESAD